MSASEALPTLKEQVLTLTRQFQEQARATQKLTRTLEQVKAEAAESKKELKQEVEQVKAEAAETKKLQGEKIAQLEGEVRGLKETSSSSSSSSSATGGGSSEPVQTGKLVRVWRGVLLLGALVPHAFAFGSLINGDMDTRFVAASKMFEAFSWVCSLAAMLGNPRNFGSWNMKLFIGLCSLTQAAHYAILAYCSGSVRALTLAGFRALICPPIYFALAKNYSKLSDRKLGAAVTALFKSIPGVLFPMLYISAESLNCIMESSSDDKLDEKGNIERCGNPTYPTLWVSVFLFASWLYTYVIPPLLPSDRILTWDNVMKLSMGGLEGLQFILFSTLSVEALVLYALTKEEGTEISDFLKGLINIMLLNYGILFIIVFYRNVIKPAICRSSPANARTSIANLNPENNFRFSDNNSINAL